MKREKYPTRKILLVGQTQLNAVLSILRNVPLDPSRPLEVRIGEKIRDRNADQNALMWAGPLRNIAEQVYQSGRSYSAEIWHEYFKREFLPEEADSELTREEYQKWDYTPDGERVLIGSTTQLTVKGFAEYLEKIYAFGASQGVQFGVSERMFA